MNHEGCSNTLTEECTKFHREFGKVINFSDYLLYLVNFKTLSD